MQHPAARAGNWDGSSDFSDFTHGNQPRDVRPWPNTSLVLDVNCPLSSTRCKLLNIWPLVTIVPDCFVAFNLLKFVPGGGLDFNGIWSRLFGRDVPDVIMKKVVLTEKRRVSHRNRCLHPPRVPTHTLKTGLVWLAESKTAKLTKDRSFLYITSYHILNFKLSTPPISRCHLPLQIRLIQIIHHTDRLLLAPVSCKLHRIHCTIQNSHVHTVLGGTKLVFKS
jgi:hypothetical protein